MELTLGQFAKQSDTAKTTIRRWLEKGLITGHKVGNTYRIDASELDRVQSIKVSRVAQYRHSDVAQTNTPQTAQVAQADGTSQTLELLEYKLATQTARANALESERDEWREHAKRLSLSYQNNDISVPECDKPEYKKPFLMRLFG